MNQDTSTPFQHLPINQVVASKTIPGYSWNSAEDNEGDEDLDRLASMAIAFGIDPDDQPQQTAPSPSTAAHAGDSNSLSEVPEAFAEIREKTLARRARRGKKESADADAVVAADAAREAVAA